MRGLFILAVVISALCVGAVREDEASPGLSITTISRVNTCSIQFLSFTERLSILSHQS